MLATSVIDRLNGACPALKEVQLGSVLDDLLTSRTGVVRGVTFWRDTMNGDDANDGLSLATPVKSLEAAYARCVDGRGDAIMDLSSGTTTAQTSVYMKKKLTWAKSGIRVFGIGAPNGYFGRARISTTDVTTTSVVISQAANSIDRESGSFVTDGWIVGMTGSIADSGANNGATFTVTAVTALSLTVAETLTVQTKAQTVSCVLTSYIGTMIEVTGSNNWFDNLHIVNGGANALSLEAVRVSANRNAFTNCHLLGGANATPGAAALCSSLTINSASECLFTHCYFGTNSTVHAGGNGPILLTGAQGQNFFENCFILSRSVTAANCAIYVNGAATLNGWTTFRNCTFLNWRESKGADLTAAVVFSATPNNTGILMQNCGLAGWGTWTDAANDAVYIVCSDATAAGAGGIATHN